MTSLTYSNISQTELKAEDTFWELIEDKPEKKGVYFNVSRNVDANKAGKLWYKAEKSV